MHEPFVGTWLLVSQHSLYAGGRREPSRGENPAGILIYDGSGNMAVQLLRTDARSGEFTDLADLCTALEGCLAYFGRYTVDEAQRVVRHHVIGASYPAWRNSTLVRRYTFAGDTLTLEAASPAGDSTRVLVWRRAAG